ncbi:MAG: anthranilate 1,2-dioxygenase small subunit [Zoogloeaceae bacterium]|jgi:anthranilate 1,2-dioxygenase (deaminating, decarboxylating) small subunit|nr:anthranilate 1,2-dioxygenase small subunit [Zoogloeaceae bacterium]
MTELNTLRPEVEDFLYRVSAACDTQDWDAYLDFFTEDAEFHIPQWDSEHVHTTDPTREMSLMYYRNRAGLEDRVFRIRTGKSAASTPLPRTLHTITNVQVLAREGDTLTVAANWQTFYYRFGEANSFFGRVRYRIGKVGDDWKIHAKQTVLMNDKINAVLDFYHV